MAFIWKQYFPSAWGAERRAFGATQYDVHYVRDIPRLRHLFGQITKPLVSAMRTGR